MFVSTVNRWLMDIHYLRVLGQAESNTRSTRSRGQTGQRVGTEDTDMVCQDQCEHTAISCSVCLEFLTWPMIRARFGRGHNLSLHWNSDPGGRACGTGGQSPQRVVCWTRSRLRESRERVFPCHTSGNEVHGAGEGSLPTWPHKLDPGP